MCHDLRTAALATLAFLTSAALPSRAAAQQFASGDLYIVSTSVGPNGNFQRGLVRVDPFLGSTQLVTPFYNLQSRACFDRFRGKILFFGAATSVSPTGLWGFDASGNATLIAPAATVASSTLYAPRGDGRIYFFTNSKQLRYLDAANAAHDVLDAAGAALYVIPTNPANASLRSIYYDAGTNAVFASWLGPNVCGSGLTNASYITKIPLLASGTQVAGAETSVPACVAVGQDSGDVFVANTFSPGPNGSLFLTFDNNAYVQCGRLVTIDPVTLSISTFATTTNYSGCPAADAGCYSTALGRGLLLDTFNDKLRTFAAGTVGEGIALASGDYVSSPGGSAELTNVLEIPFGIFGGLANYGTGTAGCLGLQTMGANSAPQVGAPNFRLTTTTCPASALGLGLVTNVANAPGADVFGLGFLVHVDLFASTELIPLDVVSNSFGFGVSSVAIPIAPTLVGLTFYAQSIWAWSACATPSPYGLSSSNGLAITVQP